MNTKVQHKRVVVVLWKHKTEKPLQVYSSLKNFCLCNKQYSYRTLSNYLGTRKIAFEDEELRIERQVVLSKPPLEDISIALTMPIVRKVLLKDADDPGNDLDYWLSRPPAERVAAVTFIISQSLKKGERLDKRKIVKRKLKT